MILISPFGQNITGHLQGLLDNTGSEDIGQNLLKDNPGRSQAGGAGSFDFEYLEVDGNHGSMVPMVWPAIFDFFDGVTTRGAERKQ